MKTALPSIVHYYKEQTKCPYCENVIGNVTLLRSQTHEHKACCSCAKHYIVEQEFLAPFDMVYRDKDGCINAVCRTEKITLEELKRRYLPEDWPNEHRNRSII